MRGPFDLEIKLPSDPTKSFPVRFLIDVKRDIITDEYIKELSNKIRQEGIHLVIILTDKTPRQEDLDYIEKNIPQIVVVNVEHRDLVKLLVISLAKSRGEEIDESLLNRAYKSLIDKFALRRRIERWIERMSREGYLLIFEGFVGETTLACRFFINTLGKPVTIKESCEDGWKLRNLLPFGIKSEIIPDMGIKDLTDNVGILKNYGFLKEENGKFHLQQHPAEERIRDLLEYYGGTTTKSTLAKHFIFSEASSKIFDSILEHMERKLLIQIQKKDNIQLLSLHHIKELKDKISKDFEKYKNSLKQIGLSFAHILTWKKKEWHIISLIKMENIIEELFKEISLASNEDFIRSRVFIIRELVKWFGYYINKVNLAFKQSKDIVSSLESEVNTLKEKFNEIYKNIKRSIKSVPTKIELQELNEILISLDEVKKMLTAEEQIDVLENKIEQMIGSKKSMDPTRTKHLWTDIDEKMSKEEKIEGEWTVAKYVLINKKREEIQEKINNFKNTIYSLDNLSQETVNITNEFLEIIKDIEMMSHEKISSFLAYLLKELIENYIDRHPFPSNVSVLTIQELHKTLEIYVKPLRNEIGQAKDIKKDISSLNRMEKDLIKLLETLERYEGFYKKFWEEDIPKNLIDEKEEILNEYKQILENLKGEDSELINFNKFKELCNTIQKQLLGLYKKTENLHDRYEKLFREIQDYLTMNYNSIQRFKEFVVPKLVKSDKNEIKKILEELETTYKKYSSWLVNILKEFTDISSLAITRTIILEEEHKLREKLIKEIKDLNEYETLILIKIIEFLVSRKVKEKWLPLTEICEKISQEIKKSPDEVKQIILAISEKGFISLAVGF
jgi:hypothetical protein